MHITPTTPVSEIAATWPGTVKVFQAHGLPFCCSGTRTLADACADAGIPFATLVPELQAAAIPLGRDDTDWAVAPLDDLIRFIVDVYHAPLRADLPRLVSMARKVAFVHGRRSPDVCTPLARCVEQLQRKVVAHLDEEEQRVFPAILDLWAQRVHRSASPADAPVAPLAALARLEADHRAIGQLLQHMAALTDWYVSPPDACNTMRALYFDLAQLTEQTYVHVHLENNVLIARVRALAGLVRIPTEEV